MRRLTSTLVSITTRGRVMTISESVLQNVRKNLFSHASEHGLGTHAIAEFFKFGNIDLANPLILFRRHNHGHVAVLAANQHWLTLRGVEERGKALFGFRGGLCSHMFILSKIDKIGKIDKMDSAPDAHACNQPILIPFSNPRPK